MSTEREKMLQGLPYDPNDPQLVAQRASARELCWSLNGPLQAEGAARRTALMQLIPTGGDTASIQAPFFCDYGSNLKLGTRVYFNFNCVVLDVSEVRIGDFTLIGPAVQIYAATHPLDSAERRRHESGKPVTIGSDVWIGGGSIICPGVSIGSRSVIGAGSVVTRDIPEGVFAAGNPCRVIREVT